MLSLYSSKLSTIKSDSNCACSRSRNVTVHALPFVIYVTIGHHTIPMYLKLQAYQKVFVNSSAPDFMKMYLAVLRSYAKEKEREREGEKNRRFDRLITQI